MSFNDFADWEKEKIGKTNNNNIEFWNNYVEIYRLRALSAISLAQYYYYYDEAYFRESNDFLGQAQEISQRTSFNSC